MQEQTTTSTVLQPFEESLPQNSQADNSTLYNPERFKSISSTQVRNNVESRTIGSSEAEKLLGYGIDMTERARRKKLDPVIGRKKEIEKVVQVLSRHN